MLKTNRKTRDNGEETTSEASRHYIETEKYGRAYFEMVDPQTLTQHPRNPPQRTNPKSEAFRKLRDTVAKDGGVMVPLHVSSDDVVEDGNGRRAVSIDLQLPLVPILRYQKRHLELEGLGLFDDLNSPTKGFKPKDQFIYALLGGEVSDFKVSSLATWTKELLIKQEFEVFMASKPSPSLVSLAKSMARYCLERGDITTDPGTRAFVRKAIMWLIRNKQQRPVVVYMQLKQGHAALKSCVENNRPVKIRGT